MALSASSGPDQVTARRVGAEEFPTRMGRIQEALVTAGLDEHIVVSGYMEREGNVDDLTHHRHPSRRASRRALQAGLPIATCSDAGMAQTHHGRNADEPAEAGMTPAAALPAASRVATEALGIGAEVGALDPAKVADLLVVRGDPLAGVGLLRRHDALRRIVRAGVVHHRDPGPSSQHRPLGALGAATAGRGARRS